MIDWIEYILLRAVVFTAGLLPVNAATGIGRFCGLLFYYLVPVRRDTALLNISFAFKDKSIKEHKTILKNMYRHFGGEIISTVLYSGMDRDALLKNFDFPDRDKLSSIINKYGCPVYITGHLGNWEMAAMFLKYHYGEITVIARNINNHLVNRYLNRIRGRLSFNVVEKFSATRAIVSSLKNNNSVGILIDQDAGNSGILADFFSLPASTVDIHAVLSYRFKKPIVPFYVLRQSNGRYLVRMQEPVLADAEEKKQPAVKRLVEKSNTMLSEMISEYPEQYLWLHKRWKTLQGRADEKSSLPAPAGKKYPRIFVRMPNWVGDVVMATPVLRTLKKVYPCSEISVVIKKSLAPLLDGCPDVDITYLYEKKGSILDRFFYWRSIINKKKFHIGVVLQESSYEFPAILFLSGVPLRAGFQRGMRFMFLNLITRPFRKKNRHQVQCYEQVLNPLDIYDIDETFYLPLNKLDKEKKISEFIESIMPADNMPLIGLNPGGAFGGTKRWHKENFIELANLIKSEKTGIPLVLWGPGEYELAREISDSSGSILAPETGLIELVFLLKHLDILISGDSGPLHIASILRKPVIGLYGPTSPDRTGPYFMPSKVFYEGLPCQPCYKKTCKFGDKRCMTAITPERVFSSLKSRFATKME